MSPQYPWYTSYQFAGNSPTKFIDLDGLEPAVKDLHKYSIPTPNGENIKIALGAQTHWRSGAVQWFDIDFLDFDMRITFEWNSSLGQYSNKAHGTYTDFVNRWTEAEGSYSDYLVLLYAESTYSLAEGLITDPVGTSEDILTEEIEASDLNPFDVIRPGSLRRRPTTGRRSPNGAKWGFNTYAKEGYRSAIDHIYDRHSYFKGGKINSSANSINKKVGVFRQNLNTKAKIQDLVDEAVSNIKSNEWVIDSDGTRTATYKFDRSIGTSREGNSTSTIKIHVDNNDWIFSAYPIEN